MTFDAPRATILIPAYNEADVIGHTLASMTDGMLPGEFRIVVVANACTDGTADVVRSVCPQARVIETTVGGKVNAMNLGRSAAHGGILICVDADLTLTPCDLRALIAPIEAGQAEAACGRMQVDMEGCSPAVRGFYGIWSRLPYARAGKFGGVIALSGKAADSVFPLPRVTSDDDYINRNLPTGQKAFVPECRFTARVPRNLATLIRVRRRVLRGNRQLVEMGLPPQLGTPDKGKAAILREVLMRPRLWPGLTVFSLVCLVSRIAVATERKTATHRWERDDSSRIGTAIPQAGMQS